MLRRFFLLILGGLIGFAACGPAAAATACDSVDHVRLVAPVVFSAQELAEFQAMPPLRVHALSAPPMALYDETKRAYTGVGVDALCFIAKQLGLRYKIEPGRDLTVADKISQVQQGQVDLFLPLSRTPERAARGVFTLPYYESFYAVVARRGQQFTLHGLADLARYRVGIVKGVSFESILRAAVPDMQLVTYDLNESEGLFRALQDGELDVVVFNQTIFAEKRYRNEYFDLEVVRTLHEYPRAYRFYLSDSPAHRRLAQAFDRYLAVMDVSGAVAAHEDGERQFLERYVDQSSQRVLLQAASVVAVLLALGFYLGLRRYRRLLHLLAEHNRDSERQQQALQAAYQELEKQSRTDGLTGLSNRHHFDRVLMREYDRWQRTGSPLSLLIIDVDHFKAVNDHYGHLVGDDYLRAVSQALGGSAARATDLVARFGGEEFACILPDTAAADALAVARKISTGVERLDLPNPAGGGPRLTVSVGAATLLGGDVSQHAFLAAADAQLYAAKQAGRDCVRGTVLDA